MPGMGISDESADRAVDAARPADALPALEPSFRFRHGWCTLHLAISGQDFAVKATTMRDAFSDLAGAMVNLTRGAVCESVIWGGEGEGAFIDLSVTHTLEGGIAVHEMTDPNWLRPGLHWTPTRGSVKFSANFFLPRFVTSFVAALEQVRLDWADERGHIAHWGWDFPYALHAELAEYGHVRPG